jgi:hypothetical protein
MVKRSMFDITTDIVTATADLFASDDEIEERLESLFNELRVKEDHVFLWVTKLQDEINLADTYLKRIQGEKKKRQNAIKSIKEMVLIASKSVGQLPAQSDFNPIKVLQSASVEIIDEGRIPQEYWVEVMTKKLDKRKIMSALRKGTKIPGADLIKNPYVKGLK